LSEQDYQDPGLVAALARRIKERCSQPLTIMEVCGTHTMSIARYGISSLLPPELRLISGPGCPVCVTDSSLIGAALAIAGLPDVIFTSFGDMLRVPAGKNSLQRCRDLGADIRIVLSPLDALELARQHPGKQVVFFAVGFETTAPLTAATLARAEALGVDNFSVIPGHKTMPEALRALLAQADKIGGLLCPGHVAAMVGAEAFRFIPAELGKPAAVAGFEPVDILLGVEALADMADQGKAKLANCYPRAVRQAGNQRALALLDQVFQPADAVWRGLGPIPKSGLSLRPRYERYDALSRFSGEIAGRELAADHPGCCCGQVLRGELQPEECPLFARACTPGSPSGACMVSSEGSCAAAYKYRRR